MADIADRPLGVVLQGTLSVKSVMIAAANEDCVYDGGEVGDGDLEGRFRGKLGGIEGSDADGG